VGRWGDGEVRRKQFKIHAFGRECEEWGEWGECEENK
jgi:hypothetical protein